MENVFCNTSYSYVIFPSNSEEEGSLVIVDGKAKKGNWRNETCWWHDSIDSAIEEK